MSDPASATGAAGAAGRGGTEAGAAGAGGTTGVAATASVGCGSPGIAGAGAGADTGCAEAVVGAGTAGAAGDAAADPTGAGTLASSIREPATLSCQPWNRPEPSKSGVKYPTTTEAARPKMMLRSSARPKPSGLASAAETSRSPWARMPIEPLPACITV